MRAGAAVIVAARLAPAETPFRAGADALLRRPGRSAFGDWHYAPLALTATMPPHPEVALRLCCCAELLTALQRTPPAQGYVTVADGASDASPPRALRLDDYRYYYRAARRAFLAFHDAFGADRPPDPRRPYGHGRWDGAARRHLAERDALGLLSIGDGELRALHAAGIGTVAQLAATPLTRVAGLSGAAFARLRAQARLRRDGRGYALRADPPAGAPLPPPSAHDVCCALYRYPQDDSGLSYLWAWRVGDAPADAFLVADAAAEKRLFEHFVDLVVAGRKADPSLRVYHYGAREATLLRRLMGRYATREREVDALLRGRTLVDLRGVVRRHLYLAAGVDTAQAVARLVGDDDAAASAAVEPFDPDVAYRVWRNAAGDAAAAQDQRRRALLEYGRDDCAALVALCVWLRATLPPAETAAPVSPAGPAGGAADADDAPHPAALLGAALRETGSAAGDPLRTLFGELVEFHRREQKPAWWRYFDRLALDDDGLYDDPDCLARLERTDTPPQPVKQSLLYEYRYRPEQETRLTPGKRTIVAERPDDGPKPLLDRLDRRRGLAYLKVGAKAELPARLSLLPDENVVARPLDAALFRLAEDLAGGDAAALPAALRDLLERRPPRLRTGACPLDAIPASADLAAATVDAVCALDRSALFIQGPPGTGKTYTGARAVRTLLAAGRRVGVMANSHQAVDNLLLKVVDLLGDAAALRVARVGGPDDGPLLARPNVARIPSAGKLALADDLLLIGGTAWTFANERLRGTVDTLFVDEAGQVALANLAAVSACCENIVLLGDQMQLGQPVQGAHPGDGGRSTLEYLLQDSAVIAPERGVFLATSYRLHPRVCEFISATVYDGRLRAAAQTENRLVEVPAGAAGPLRRPAGLFFVAVEHDGNSRASVEEAERIRELARSLLGRVKTGVDGRPDGVIGWDDMLFVAPYNVQVNLLQQTLGDDAKVGSVDRFQGQEAAVVFVSMCASAADDDGGGAARGIEFLFSRNRLNVAISRAQSLALVVGNPRLALTGVRTLEQMALVNLYARLVEEHAVAAA